MTETQLMLMLTAAVLSPNAFDAQSARRPSDPRGTLAAVSVPMPIASPMRGRKTAQKAEWTGGDVFGGNQ